MRPALHTEFVGRVLAQLPADPRVLALAAAGSWVRGEMDEQSDVDLVVAVAPENVDGVIADGRKIAASLGSLLSCFAGDHLGKPALLICLYGPPLLHVDYSFHTLAFAAELVGKAAVLWERDGALSRLIQDDRKARGRTIDLQWMEDRIWVWLHYGGSKIARGEFFEAIDAITFIRGAVLGPLILTMHERPPFGMRRVETVAGDDLPALRATVARYDPASCLAALLETGRLYRALRERYATPALIRRSDAETTVIAWLETLAPPA